jgi:uncharacterized protein (DUF849 family)
MSAERALIVNAALTGMVPTKADNPNVPVSPEEIADDAERVVGAGAAVVHLHARDETGAPSWRPDIYRRIVASVRDRCPEVVVCVSTSGRVFKEFEERAAVLDLDGDEQPELASLTLGSLNFPKQASINEPDMIRRLAERMRERDVVPELEIFDLGMVDYLHYLLDRGVLEPPLYVNVLLGSLGTLAATPANLVTVVRAPVRGDVVGGGHRAVSARRRRAGDRDGWARPCGSRGRPLAGCREDAAHDEPATDRAGGANRRRPRAAVCDARSGTGADRPTGTVASRL